VRAVVFQEVGTIRVDDIPEPKIEGPTDAIVRISVAGICGSDLHFLHGKAPMFEGEQIGHEGMGTISEVGPEVTRFKPGDRVVMAFDIADGDCWFCRHGQSGLCENFRNLGAGIFGGSLGGTQAEYVRVPVADVNVLAVPDGVDDEHAVFVGDILTTGVYGAGISGIQPGDVVAVVGAGPVGYFTAQAARLHDPAEVLVLDMQPDRLALMEKVGATPINVKERNAQTAVHDLTEGRGADVVIDAVGHLSAFESALDVVRRGGTVCVLGMYTTESVDFQLGLAYTRGIKLVLSGYTHVVAWWERAMQAVADGTIDPIPLISHRMKIDDAVEAYRLFDSREATKVLLEP
jgi:2-desacetyl-2-hydroxyethyl bacteriochlorophyllide A dehydrogenase